MPNDDDDYGDFEADDSLIRIVEATERAAAKSRAPPPPPPAPVATGASGSKAPQQQQPQKSALVKQPIPQKVAPRGGAAIQVNACQRGNPILTLLKSVPWAYTSTPPVAADYILSPSTLCMFLSLKYHKLHPEYIIGRLAKLPSPSPPAANVAPSGPYPLRLLLLLCDIDQTATAAPLKEITLLSIRYGMTLLCAWSAPEAARYLELYHTLAKTPPTMIMGVRPKEWSEQVVEVMGKVRGVSGKDALALVAEAGSVKKAVAMEEEEVRGVSGWGQTKAERWRRVCEMPFVERSNMDKERLAEKTQERRKQAAEEAARKKKEAERRRAEFGQAVDDDEEALRVVAELEAQEREKGAGGGQRVGEKRRLEDVEEVESDEEDDFWGRRNENTEKDSEKTASQDKVMEALRKMRENAK